ncbi:MAG TPA: hypothetical protein QGF41_11145 [Gammaproteobacteria bacterium]|nr:hypothetical protein [Gammaproteobacteria bacterium]
MASGTLNTRRWNGEGTSGATSVSSLCSRDTVMPSVTVAIASSRFSGVIRLAAPSWSSDPQRPQFESSSIIRSMSAWVRSWDSGETVGGTYAAAVVADAPPSSAAGAQATPATVKISKQITLSSRMPIVYLLRLFKVKQEVLGE